MFVASLVGLARGSAALSFVGGNWRSALAAGAMGVLTYGLALYALALGPVAQVAALRETSVVFAAILGAYVLKEPLGKKRIAAALLTFAGIVLMHLGQ